MFDSKYKPDMHAVQLFMAMEQAEHEVLHVVHTCVNG